MIRGTTVTLYNTVVTGYDPFGAPICTEEKITVKNVLVGEPSTDDVTNSTNLYGRTISYMLGIPKGDKNDWTNKKVEWTDAYGTTHVVMTFGEPITGIEANVPTKWHKKVRCESYA